MFDLTRQEKIVITFLAAAFLSGVVVLWFKNLYCGAAAAPAGGKTEVGGESRGTPTELSVTVSGAVLHPGVYRVKKGAPASDVIDRAVPLVDADVQAVADRPIETEGAVVAVPLAKRSRDSAAGVGAVNINTATGEELDRLPGIGPKIASRIVEHRKSRPFREAKDLMNVDGIGEKKYDALKDRITVH